MKILFTRHYYHRNKDRIKQDILDIGRILGIFKDNTRLDIRDDGILLTWGKAYDSENVITDINDIARALKITENTCLNWRDIE